MLESLELNEQSLFLCDFVGCSIFKTGNVIFAHHFTFWIGLCETCLTGEDGGTFVELVTVEKLGLGWLVPGPWSVPDELATHAVIAVFEVLIGDVNA